MPKLIIASDKLLKNISGLISLVPSNPIIPILENLLFECKDGILTVTASDLQNVMSVQIAVETEDTFNVAVPAKMLKDTLSNLPAQPITFTIDTVSHGIEMLSDNGRYTIAGEDAGDFPRPAQPKNTTNFLFDAKELKSAISQTDIFVSSDEMKPAMNGVCFNFQEDSLRFAATDSHRLIRIQIGDESNGTTIKQSPIVPGKALTVLSKALSSAKEGGIQFEFNETNVFFSFANTKIVSRLIDERFPDYENVIPVSNDKHLIIDRSQLLSSLKRISIYANKTSQQIRFKLENNNLLVSAEDVDFSNEAKENLPCDYEGESIEIGFNGKFLLEILSNLDCNQVHFEFSEPNRAALLYPNEVDKEQVLILVMPVMLNNYY